MPQEPYELNSNELAQYMRSFFSFLINGTFFFVSVARRKILILLATFAISFALIFLYFKNGQKVVKYRMSCNYNDNNSRIFGEMLSHLDLMLENKSYRPAAGLLGVSVNDVMKVVSIKGKTVALGRLEEDYSLNRTPFYIDVELLDTSVKVSIENALLNYLNNNELSVRTTARQRAKWNSRALFYQQQLQKLDSLKEVIRQSYLLGSNHIEMSQQNNSVVDIYKLSDSMSFFLADIDYYLKQYKTVEKVYGLTSISNHSNGSGVKKALILSLLCLLVVWLFLAGIVFLKQSSTNQSLTGRSS